MPDAVKTADAFGVTPHTIALWQAERAPVPDDPANNDQFREMARWIARQFDTHVRNAGPAFSQTFLNIGFAVGLVLCVAAFIVTALYLYDFKAEATSHFKAGALGQDSMFLSKFGLIMRLVTLKMALLSCGVMAGAALTFLGLALFLIGIRGAMNVDATGGSFQGKLVNVAPGTLILLAGAILVSICTTRDFSVTTDNLPIAPALRKNGDVTSERDDFKFAATLQLATKLRSSITEAEQQDGEAQKCLLKRVWYFADTIQPLISEYISSLQDVQPNATAIRDLDALKLHLAEISKTEEQYGGNPAEAIQKMKQALESLEKDLAAVSKS